ISASGTTISGTKAVAFNANAVRVKLEVVVLDSSDASTQTGTSPALTVDNTSPTYAVTYSRAAPLKAGAVTITVTASEALSAAPVISIDQPGTTDISSVTMSGNGPYTYAYTIFADNAGAYADGTATVSVSGTDLAGNTGTTVTSGGTFAIDTTPPVSTGVSLTSSDTGTASDRITSVAPVLGVTAESGSTVAVAVTKDGSAFTLYSGLDSITGTGTAVTWTPLGVPASGSTGEALADGVYVFSFTQTDAAGNVQSSASTLTVTVDTTAPTAATGLAFTASGGTVVSNALNATNTNFTVTATVTGDVGSAGGTAELLVGGASFGTPVTARVANGATTVSLTPSFTTAAQVQAAMASGSKVLTVKLTDSAGNTVTSSGDGNTVTVTDDYGAPTVSSVTTSTVAGSYKAAGTVAITVTFSEAVTSTGTSSLLLETGSTDTAATCAAVTASTTLSCTYTVVAGDTTSHLDYQSTSALTGTIADVAGNSATLTLPALRSSGLYTGQTIIIDTTAP
ncbi:MAG: hypothetical protein EBQ56_13925, partial [Proteobacteria bacterium]|nr:hypothetical protein [Pseudomonadota bacterium]